MMRGMAELLSLYCGEGMVLVEVEAERVGGQGADAAHLSALDVVGLRVEVDTDHVVIPRYTPVDDGGKVADAHDIHRRHLHKSILLEPTTLRGYILRGGDLHPLSHLPPADIPQDDARTRTGTPHLPGRGHSLLQRRCRIGAQRTGDHVEVASQLREQSLVFFAVCLPLLERQGEYPTRLEGGEGLAQGALEVGGDILMGIHVGMRRHGIKIEVTAQHLLHRLPKLPAHTLSPCRLTREVMTRIEGNDEKEIHIIV